MTKKSKMVPSGGHDHHQWSWCLLTNMMTWRSWLLYHAMVFLQCFDTVGWVI